jgi:peptidoglycan hydrolase-like protein with peptidoglycan-binding domain
MQCLLAVAALACGLVQPSSVLAVGRERAQPPGLSPRQAAATLRLGARGSAILALQRNLTRLTYLPYVGVDGVFGVQTWHAVVAFQGWSGLARDGIAGPLTLGALTRARTPTPWSRATGFEIHVREQVRLLVRVPDSEARTVWQFGALGMRVWTGR